MRLKSLRIRNFRTIAEEQTVEFNDGFTIVGPNNTGKTNILRAIQMLYTGFDNHQGYLRSRDLTFGKNREQTTLVAVFDRDHEADDEVLIKYGKLLDLYVPPRPRNEGEISLQLIFSNAGSPSYRLSSDSTSRLPKDQQSTHSRLIHEIVDSLVSSTAIHFVPSSNSSDELFKEIVSPLVKSSVARQLETELSAIRGALSTVSESLTTIVQSSGLSQLGIHLQTDDGSIGGFLSHFDFTLSDPARTSAFDKGRGIQALAMLACFAWIAHQERHEGLSSIWLIEEPESYLHPELYPSALQLLAEIEKSGQVIRTTHAMTMVPRATASIVGTATSAEHLTTLQRFGSTEEATNSLRGSLGVRFSDYFGLSDHNIFVEGPTDVTFLEWAIPLLGGEKQYPLLSGAMVRAFGGTKNLAGFLKANYGHIRPETAVVSIFDGDDAGRKAIREVQQYLGNHGSGFEANVDWVIARAGFAVEGLFPDLLLAEAQSEHPGWFDSWMIDAGGVVIAFDVKDSSKAQLGALLRSKAETSPVEGWSPHWRNLLDTTEAALAGWRSGRR